MSSKYLLIGIALALPFFLANALVALQAEFFLSILRPSGVMTFYEQILVLVLMALVCVGGIVALLPIAKNRRLYILNALVGLAFVTFSIFAGHGLAYDFYKCDILQIPNCE